ncbi:hypothetical protein BKA69DRAFT_394607 [Paraphysoderma sedebokerense]|nr:hypothetical protein BKA69DRAFT_394607 [Paraphysoderma sedebokerense]
MCEPPSKVLKCHNGTFFRCEGAGLSTAGRIRSGLSWYWGNQWSVSHMPYNAKTLEGNPALSHRVSRYILTLTRQKALQGESPESVRALRPQDMKELCDACYRMAGYDRRLQCLGAMLYTIFLLAYLCLLRIEEVLQIEMRYLELCPKTLTITLTLDYRKTKQEGGYKPFVLYPNLDNDWLCPYRALITWLAMSRIVDGPLFVKFDRIVVIDRKSRVTYKYVKDWQDKLL